jgi:hypothetical protein
MTPEQIEEMEAALDPENQPEYHALAAALAAAYAAARIRQRDTLLRLIAEAPLLEETQ